MSLSAVGCGAASRRQRLRIVAGSMPGWSAARIRNVPGGGSSSVFSSALAACGFIRSAGAITATFARCRWLVSATKSISARIRWILIVSTAFSFAVLLVDLDQLEAHQVGMLPGDGIAAAGAFAAGELIGARRLAQQRLREAERQRVLADPARSVDQQRVRPGGALRQRLAHRLLLPRKGRQPRQRRGALRRFALFGHQRAACSSAARWAASSARTSASGRVLSITRKRRGSRATRSR